MSKITNVLVIGANGTIGLSAIHHLLAANFRVSALIRSSSTQPLNLPSSVQIFKTDYTPISLTSAFHGQDAVVSTISGSGLAHQKDLVDAAITAGVKLFLPSEYGIDTSHPDATELIPFLHPKIETLQYLKFKQNQIAWTALCTGSLFDWSLDIPGFGGIDVPGRKATIYDGGQVEYEATTTEQVGRAIAAVLKQELKVVANQHVYVNSFTVTQKKIVGALESAMGEKFVVERDSVKNLRKKGFELLEEGNFGGMLKLIASTFYGEFGVADYSKTKGLWNERLGLEGEDLDEVLRTYFEQQK